MIENAIAKLKAEMDQNKNNPYIQVVGGFLIQELNVNPGAAEKILAEGKTIGKSLDEMRRAAEKKKVGNCAVLTDQEGFDIVLKYFDIKRSAPVATPVQSAQQNEIKAVESTLPSIDFDIGLDDLL